jgi:hypothetical protein
MKPLALQGSMDQHDKSNLQSAIDALNGATVGRLQLTDNPDDLDFRTNIQNIFNSINSGYKRKLQLQGRVKDLTLRTNLTNIINRHNSKVASEGKNNG